MSMQDATETSEAEPERTAEKRKVSEEASGRGLSLCNISDEANTAKAKERGSGAKRARAQKNGKIRNRHERKEPERAGSGRPRTRAEREGEERETGRTKARALSKIAPRVLHAAAKNRKRKDAKTGKLERATVRRGEEKEEQQFLRW